MSTTFNAWAAAIAQNENSQWPNNPGALKDAAGNKLDFGSLSAGYQALQDKLQYDTSGKSAVYSPNMSLADFEKLYTNGDPNAANNIGAMLGVPTSTPISNLSDQTLSQSSGNLLSKLWDKYMKASSQMQDGDISNPNTAIAGITGQTPEQLATSGTSAGISMFTNVTAVVVGLVLIAGAVFGFSQVRETVVSTAKGAAALAA
jgi:hypothetical protein